MGTEQPAFAEIAGGYCPQNAGIGGTKIDSVNGFCSVISGGTGLRQITLLPPYDGLTAEDLIVLYNLGDGTASGTASIAMSAISAGVFLLELFNGGVLTDLSSYFLIKVRPKVK